MKAPRHRLAAAASTRSRGSSRRARACRRCSSRPATPAPRPRTGVENVAHHRASPSWSPSPRRKRSSSPWSGPEAPLAAGVVDAFRDAGLRIFGPTRAAAQLESSKDFAKSFMARHKHPDRAAHATFDDAERSARRTSTKRGAPIVVKADGLAAGKGVVVAASVAEAHAAIDADADATRASATPARASWSRSSCRARKRASSS